MWRQGDLFIEPISSFPRTKDLLRHGVLLEGEAEAIDGDTVQIGDTVFRLEVG